MKLLLTSFKKHWLTILGSLILVGAWYGEKVKVSEATDKIADMKEQRLDYSIKMLQHNITAFNTELQAFNYKHDTILKLEDICGAYAQEARISLTVDASSVNIQKAKEGRSLSDITQSFDNFRKKQNEITTLLNSLNYDQLYTKVKTFRKEMFQLTINDQVELNQVIYEQQKKIERIQLITLLFYAFGIILITMDKMKDELFQKKEKDELVELLKHVKEQNTKLLHKKDK